ncbi:competence protein ComGD [Streptohalobacillus salinus]|uniref:Competence protein ComGD n=1 Tax=Streptohalobacillus salinus TaxID=621096 RepID=A0A2V3WB17_9BACI|nr:competence protein ComGD [Streptohalobacillus salinus]
MSQSHNQVGFTLIELLIVLSFLQLILMFSSFHYAKSQDLYQFQLWYVQFEHDLLYVQKKTMITTLDMTIQLNPNRYNYEIRYSPIYSPEEIRTYNKDWQLELLTTSYHLRFSRNGNFKSPGQMRLTTTYYSHQIYFPFGKGRAYVITKER